MKHLRVEKILVVYDVLVVGSESSVIKLCAQILEYVVDGQVCQFLSSCQILSSHLWKSLCYIMCSVLVFFGKV